MVPFIASASVPAPRFPTAVQVVDDVHDTPESVSLPLAGLGVFWMAQVAPFHTSTRAPLEDVTTE
jgi:hypothetical protein